MNEVGGERVRVAFIGCGSHSSKTLQPNAHQVPEIEVVVALAGRLAFLDPGARRRIVVPHGDGRRRLRGHVELYGLCRIRVDTGPGTEIRLTPDRLAPV